MTENFTYLFSSVSTKDWNRAFVVVPIFPVKEKIQ